MPNLDSQEVRRQFKSKLKAEEDDSSKDHYFYLFRIGNTIVASTKISRKSRHTISDDLVARMARQLGVSSNALAGAVTCSLETDGFYKLLAMGVPFRKRTRKKKPSMPTP